MSGTGGVGAIAPSEAWHDSHPSPVGFLPGGGQEECSCIVARGSNAPSWEDARPPVAVAGVWPVTRERPGAAPIMNPEHVGRHPGGPLVRAVAFHARSTGMLDRLCADSSQDARLWRSALGSGLSPSGGSSGKPWKDDRYAPRFGYPARKRTTADGRRGSARRGPQHRQHRL
jgi:hypothetical protein